MRLFSTLMQTLRKGLVFIICVGLLSITGWFSLPHQSSYALSTPEEALQEIRRDQSMQDRQEAYRDAIQITEDPKMGVEEAYEEEVDEYFEEHPEEGGILQGAKNVVEKVTGKE